VQVLVRHLRDLQYQLFYVDPRDAGHRSGSRRQYHGLPEVRSDDPETRRECDVLGVPRESLER
jgi:hypothetical protein